MKKIFVFLLLTFLSCNREYNNPTETDSDLSVQPQITQVQETSEHFITLSLNYSFSDSAEIILERKKASAFEHLTFKKESESVLIDTSLDRELNYTFSYRVKVQKTIKGKIYSTAYSAEKRLNYTTTILNTPENLTLQTIELQGVKLLWEDKSGKEDGYKVEKNSGSGFTEIATLPANSTSYMDTISGTPTPPLNLSYRVKAYNATLSSSWKEISTVYSGLGSPTNLTIIDSSFWKFTIQWQRNSSIATGYVVERKRDVGNYVTLANVGATISSYVDTLKDSGSYSYRVKAKKDNLYSAYSNEVVYNLTEVLPTQGLVAYYPFNGNANDESGNGNNGTVNGATLTPDRFGRANKAYSFNGVSAWINTNYNANMANVSLVAWMKTNTTDANYRGIICARSGFNNEIGLNLHNPSNSVNWNISNNSSTVYQVITQYVVLNDNNWHLVVGTYDGSNEKIYVDGVLNNTKSYSITLSNNSYYKIGYDDYFTVGYFNGSIDGVCIYNRALTEQEVQALYHEGGWQ